MSDSGFRADVYWNFHKDTYAIRCMEPGHDKYGIVTGYADGVIIDNAEFVVQAAGLKKARETGKRNVHAFVRGDVTYAGDDVLSAVDPTKEWVPFRYRPFLDKYRDLDRPFIFIAEDKPVPVPDVDVGRVVVQGNLRFGVF